MKNHPAGKVLIDEYEFFANMSKDDLADLGLGDVAYVRRHLVNGQEAFVLHAANGHALGAQKNIHDVEAMAYHQEIELVTLH
jgi:hypothetical protein